MKSIILISSIVLSTLSSHATCDMDGAKIMDKVIKSQSAKQEHEIQHLFLIDLNSNVKEKRTIERYGIDDISGNTKTLINFTEPSEIKGTALLSWNQGDSKDQWLYIPANRKLQRIASGSKKSYFMGTDFTYADLDGEIRSENDYQCLKQLSCQNGKSNCYQIEATPKSPEIRRKTGYKKRILTIDADKFITYQVDYYNLANSHFKTGRYQKWKSYAGIMRPEVASMDRHNKHKTFIKIIKRNINQSVDPVVFTKRYLEKNMHIK